jgi:hypothetical protein
MKIKNADYEIDYASAIGDAATVDFPNDDTDETNVTTTATATATATKESYD